MKKILVLLIASSFMSSAFASNCHLELYPKGNTESSFSLEDDIDMDLCIAHAKGAIKSENYSKVVMDHQDKVLETKLVLKKN